MGSGPALQICGKNKEVKEKIEMVELLGFVEKIFTMDFEDVFKAPEIEASETPALRKRKRYKRLEAFEVLRISAHVRVRSIEEDVTSEVEGRFELHRARLGDIDVDRLLRAGTSGPSGTASNQASTSMRPNQYKPVEAFLGSKKFPWWRTGDTVVSADDLDKLSDYLYSGGHFTDIEQPLMYMK